MKSVVICGSIAFIDEMQETKKTLEALGHEVKIPPTEMIDENGKVIPSKEYYTIRKAAYNDANSWIWGRKNKVMREYFDEVAWSNVILVLNYAKNDIAGYIGGNTLLEMGLAFYLGKKIYLLNPIQEISYKEEILAMRPIVIERNLDLLQ